MYAVADCVGKRVWYHIKTGSQFRIIHIGLIVGNVSVVERKRELRLHWMQAYINET